MHKILLLNGNYEILHFISVRKAVRLLVNDKVDILSYWDEKISYGSGHIILPSILKLKYIVKRRFLRFPFSRNAVLQRDRFTCVYCGMRLHSTNTTIDHIVPKKDGGKSTFYNCVAACLSCNTKKGSKSLEQSGLKLKREPRMPVEHIFNISENDIIHPDWKIFLNL